MGSMNTGHQGESRDAKNMQLIRELLIHEPYLQSAKIHAHEGRVIVTVPSGKTQFGASLKQVAEDRFEMVCDFPKGVDKVYGTSFTATPQRGRPFQVVVTEERAGVGKPRNPNDQIFHGGGVSTQPIDMDRRTPGAGRYHKCGAGQDHKSKDSPSLDEERLVSEGSNLVRPNKRHLGEVKNYLKKWPYGQAKIALSDDHGGCVVVKAKGEYEKYQIGLTFRLDLRSVSPENNSDIHVIKSDKQELFAVKLVVAEKGKK